MGIAGVPARGGGDEPHGLGTQLAQDARIVLGGGEGALQGGLGQLAGWTVLIGVVLGSALTVAYTARFLWGTFATKPGAPRLHVEHIRPGFLAAPALLAALSFEQALAELEKIVSELESGQAPLERSIPGLALWHKPGLALAFSMVSLGLGLVLFWRREAFALLQSVLASTWSSERGYLGAMRRLDRIAVEVTGLTQRGSLAIYLSVILAVIVILPGSALLMAAGGPSELVRWDDAGQLAVAVVVVVAAVLTARSRRRLKAVVMVGVTGYGTATLFLLHGAPDLALTQVLVETVSLVVFVLVVLALIALIALPMTLIIVTGEIDLSVASTLGLSSAVMGALWEGGLPLETIIPVCILVGALSYPAVLGLAELSRGLWRRSLLHPLAAYSQARGWQRVQRRWQRRHRSRG